MMMMTTTVATTTVQNGAMADEYGTNECYWPSQVDDALGVLSLLIWALTLVVTLQYVVVILSLGYNGEGGHMALAAQIIESKAWPTLKVAALWIAVIGTGFVIADGKQV